MDEDVTRKGTTNAEVPTGFSCQWSSPEDVVVTATVVKCRTEPICHWKQGSSKQRYFKTGTVNVDSIERASIEIGGRFCPNCEVLLKASLKHDVLEFYNQV